MRILEVRWMSTKARVCNCSLKQRNPGAQAQSQQRECIPFKYPAGLYLSSHPPAMLSVTAFRLLLRPLTPSKLNTAFPESFVDDYSEAESVSDPEPMSLFDIWRVSRPSVSNIGRDGKLETLPLQPGAQRKFNLSNILLAGRILQATLFNMLALLWGLNPLRTSLLLCLTIIRGLLPAFRGYSQALILDEVRVIPILSIF